MAELSERHEVRVRAKDQTIVFLVDSSDGRLVIRQEREGEPPAEVCSITLSNPDELQTFFQGLRRILASLEYREPAGTAPVAGSGPSGARGRGRATLAPGSSGPNQPSALSAPEPEREAIVEQARQRNPNAFAPWTREEEQEIRRQFEAGEPIPSIARSHKRSPRAIELRLQRMGAMPRDQ
jgi:hypothetical protein